MNCCLRRCLITSSYTMFMAMGSELLSSQDASSSNSLDLLFGLAGEEASLHDDWLLGESSLTENLEKSSPGAVDNRCLGSLSSILHPGLLRDKGPQLVNVDAWLVQVGVIGVDVEVPHTDLSEISGMVFVEVDSVVVLSTSVSATSGVLPVLPDPAMSVGDMSSQLAGLLLSSGHFWFLLLL